MNSRTILPLSLLVLSSCAHELPDTPWHVDDARILAVEFDPPEAASGDTVSAKVLVASPGGTVDDASVDWTVCRTPKPPSENRSVNQQCFGNGAEAAGTGTNLSVVLPKDGCALYGPETPPGDFRPRDPDRTGGYYQPFELVLGGRTAVALERIVCNLRSASVDAALDYKARYVMNRNPTIASVDATVAGVATPLDRIPNGATVRFAVHWTPGDDERYVLYDPGSQNVVGSRETIEVAWYTTESSLEPAYTEAAAGATSAEMTWHAPVERGTSHFWVVLRDSRGGSDFTAWDAVVD